MDITKLETRPNYIGYKVENGIETPVEADFRQLLADHSADRKMRQIGYLWSDGNVTFIQHLDEATVERVTELIASQLGVDVARVGNPPPIIDELHEEQDD